MKKFLSLLLILGTVVVGRAQSVDLKSLEGLAVQEGGRKKPLLTYANESLQKLMGRATWKKSETEKLSSMDVLFSMLLNQQEDWEGARLVRLGYIPLKKKLGLPEEQNFFSIKELSSNKELLSIIDSMRSRGSQSMNPEFNKIENEASALSAKMLTWREMVSGSALRLIPHPKEPRGEWITVPEAGRYYPEKEKEILDTFKGIVTAYQAKDSAALTASAGKFKSTLRSLAPGVYPEESRLNLELQFNHFHPFRKAWIVYTLAFILMLMATRKTPGLRSSLYWPALALYLLGLGIQMYGFYQRITISERPPVTNMYEVMIWVAFGAAFFAAIFELIYRQRYFVLAAAGVATLSLILADNIPAVLDPSIKPLVPVLVNNYWLTVHVLTITLGYAGFMLALGIGHIVLGYYVFKPRMQGKIDQLTNFNYRAMQVGLLFLTTGTILGGVWANDSWGRFWGWDPKETWALIAILCYLVVLHGRFAGWMGDFALNVASVVCFQAIIFAAYGVNFVLGKGLHSYGFGVGGEWAVASYVGLELVAVGLAVWRYKLNNPTVKLPPGAPKQELQDARTVS